MSATAYSYVRFSTPEQRQGNSLKRQTEATAAWCKRNGVVLDTALTLRDLGVSAFKGKHRDDKNALGEFLRLARQGRIPAGSYLVIENLDRLSREDERTALRLWMDILDCKIHIVQLKPETVFRHDKSDMIDIMRAIIELSRGHSESARKSERNGAAWAEKIRRVQAGEAQKKSNVIAEGSRVYSKQLPAWVEERDGLPVLIPERAEVVRRIFLMALGGCGVAMIVKRLTEEGVPPFGKRERHKYVTEEGEAVECWRAAPGGRYGSGKWVRAYVAKILKDRRAVGEFQPCGTGRKPSGRPIKSYYPPVVSEEEFDAVAGGLEDRRQPRRRGRPAKHVNLFSGLIYDARNPDDTFFTGYSRGRQVLVNTAGAERQGPRYVSFPADVFERAVLSLLREIDPTDVVNGDDGPDEALVLAGQLTGVEALIAALKEELERGDVRAIAEKLREKEAQRTDLAARLAEARRRAAHPLSETWGEMQSLLATLDGAIDREEARLRLRSKLRQTVERITLLVLPRGRVRLAFVQVRFNEASKAGRRRDYLIYHCPPFGSADGRKPGYWQVVGVGDKDVPGEAVPFDLRGYAKGKAVRGRVEALAGRMLPAFAKNHANAIRMRGAWEQARAADPDLGEMDLEGDEGVGHAFYGILP
jgi:DNA invertase Pin-like site-specific DNA recombinase